MKKSSKLSYQNRTSKSHLTMRTRNLNEILRILDLNHRIDYHLQMFGLQKTRIKITIIRIENLISLGTHIDQQVCINLLRHYFNETRGLQGCLDVVKFFFEGRLGIGLSGLHRSSHPQNLLAGFSFPEKNIFNWHKS